MKRPIRLLVVNPNTSVAVTERFCAEAAAVAPSGVHVTGVTAAFGAAIVSTEAENVIAGHAALQLLARHGRAYDAAILAISFDSALAAAREVMPIPVVGLTEASLAEALSHHDRIGLVVFGAVSRPLYDQLLVRYGVTGRVAGIEVVDVASARGYRETGSGRRRLKEADLNRQRAEIGMVFQSFNLWPHRTVIENIIEAPILVRRIPRGAAIETARQLLDRVGLLHKQDAYPGTLSGGQQQRVAIARSLAMQPKIMLLDEVTSALDPETVREVLDVVKDLAHEGMTMVLVTHEMAFAREVAHRIVFMDEGLILEDAPPAQFFSAPVHPRARAFLEKVL